MFLCVRRWICRRISQKRILHITIAELWAEKFEYVGARIVAAQEATDSYGKLYGFILAAEWKEDLYV